MPESLCAQKIFDGMLHCVDGQTLYASRGRTIYRSTDWQNFSTIGDIPIAGIKGILAQSRTFARAKRFAIHHAMIFRGVLVIFGYGQIWSMDPVTGQILAPPTPFQGSRPLTVCATSDRIYYGEYINNAERAPVSIFQSSDGLAWEAALTLTGIRHFHGVYQNPFDGALWATTGDYDGECRILRSTNGFGDVETVLQGSQQTRAIDLLFEKDAICFGTDTPEEPNNVYRLKTGATRPDQLFGVSGSVFFATTVAGQHFVSTAVEPSKANPSRSARIYQFDGQGNHAAVFARKKDFLPMKLFQYGQIQFPKGVNNSSILLFSLFSLIGDNTCWKAPIF